MRNDVVQGILVSDRAGLAPNPGGSVDIFIQNAAPAGYASNWLPAPAGKFILWLRGGSALFASPVRELRSISLDMVGFTAALSKISA